MEAKLTIQERLKDLRVAHELTLEQLAAGTGLSRSALGNYENDEFKDISPFAITTLAKFYSVSRKRGASGSAFAGRCDGCDTIRKIQQAVAL